MGSATRSQVRAAVHAVAVVLLAVAAAAPAQAAPPPPGSDTDPYNPGIVYRTVYSRPGSSSTVAFSVACPAGYRPFGGGVEVTGAANQVIVHRAEPVHSATESGFFAAASERADLHVGDYPGTWQLRVVVACGPAYPDLAYVRSTTASSSSKTKITTAVCPAGLTRVGMGGAIVTESRAVRFDQLGFGSFSNESGTYPSVPESVRAIASELPSGTGASWSLTAVVVCATPPRDVIFSGMNHGYGIDVENGQYVYADEEQSEPCGGWLPENHSYVTGVGAGQDGDPGEVNLEWFIHDDREVGGMTRALENGGYAGWPMSSLLSLVCVRKA